MWYLLMLASILWIALGSHSQAHAQGEHIISGEVVNGTSGKAGPAGLEVVLHIIEGQATVKTFTTQTDQDGHFRFAALPVGDPISYFLSVAYQEVPYGTRVDSTQPTSHIEITVFDITSNMESLRLETDVLLIRGADEDSNSLSILELVSLVNDGERTFVPDLTQGGSMNFLRFSLPPDFYDLEVQASLPTGQLLTIDRGFAITAPVLPGSHEIAFTYHIPYSEGRLQFLRSFPLETGTFSLLLPEGIGHVVNGDIREVEALPLPGGTYRVWEASQLAAGSRLSVSLEGLPQPPLLQRLGKTLTEGLYLKIGIPAGLGAFLALILVLSLLRRQPLASVAHNTGSLEGNAKRGERQTLVEAIARLDDLFESGEIDEEDYTTRRMELKHSVLQPKSAPNRTIRSKEIEGE